MATRGIDSAIAEALRQKHLFKEEVLPAFDLAHAQARAWARMPMELKNILPTLRKSLSLSMTAATTQEDKDAFARAMLALDTLEAEASEPENFPPVQPQRKDEFFVRTGRSMGKSTSLAFATHANLGVSAEYPGPDVSAQIYVRQQEEMLRLQTHMPPLRLPVSDGVVFQPGDMVAINPAGEAVHADPATGVGVAMQFRQMVPSETGHGEVAVALAEISPAIPGIRTGDDLP